MSLLSGQAASPAAVPTQLRQYGPKTLGIQWNDGHASLYNVRRLRLECRCARCVDEWTREKLLKDTDVPEDVKPVRFEPIGRYAYRIDWTDGHGTGYYTFDHLRSLCECPVCRQRSS